MATRKPLRGALPKRKRVLRMPDEKPDEKIECRGTSQTITLDKGVYRSATFPCDSAAAKTDAIIEILDKLDWNGPLCVGKCPEGEKCVPVKVKLVGEVRGQVDMTIMRGKLFGEAYCQYVVWAKAKGKVTVTTFCDCS